MKLIEADGKRILKDAGIAVPLSWMPDNVTAFPVYLKAQVLQGRRGQLGLVRYCADRAALERNVREITEALKDLPSAGFICEMDTPHVSEWLLAIHLDRANGNIVASVSDAGGMDVAHAASHPLSSAEDVDVLGLSSGVAETLKKMFVAFIKNDALHLEINPLACLVDGSCIALDAKVELDDAAAFRHPEWAEFHALSESGRRLSEREEAYAKRQEQAGHRGTLGRYVELDGDIALVLSGGGASLVAIDALKAAGGKPANYVEMSGNPDPEAVREAAKIVLSKPSIKAIWIAGSFANFTDIQATVGATLQAIAELGLTVPIVIRRDGPNAEAAQADALAWGKTRGCDVRFDLAEIDLDASAQAVVAASKGV